MFICCATTFTESSVADASDLLSSRNHFDSMKFFFSVFFWIAFLNHICIHLFSDVYDFVDFLNSPGFRDRNIQFRTAHSLIEVNIFCWLWFKTNWRFDNHRLYVLVNDSYLPFHLSAASLAEECWTSLPADDGRRSRVAPLSSFCRL
jgi:hypothetical protein